jgi:hypothetical protein
VCVCMCVCVCVCKMFRTLQGRSLFEGPNLRWRVLGTGQTRTEGQNV